MSPVPIITATCFFTLAGCWMVPMPETTRIAKQSFAEIQTEILQLDRVKDVYLYLAAISAKARQNGLDTPQVWSEAMDVLTATHAKAQTGWPTLEVDPEFAKNIGHAGKSPEAIVRAEVRATVSSLADYAGNPIASQYRNWLVTHRAD